MGSALEAALILGRRCDSYIEGFALRWEIAEFTEADHREIARMEVHARATFESFMRKHGVARSGTTTDTPSFGWLENAPDGDAFVGSYGRVFDVIVMSRSDRNATRRRDHGHWWVYRCIHQCGLQLSYAFRQLQVRADPQGRPGPCS